MQDRLTQLGRIRQTRKKDRQIARYAFRYIGTQIDRWMKGWIDR